MSYEPKLGDFEDSEDVKVMELYDDYTSAYEFFDELYFNVVGCSDKPGITILEYDEIGEAIRVGQCALRFGGELETMNPTKKFLNLRSELSDQVRVLLNTKKHFDSNPHLIDFNPDKYRPIGGTDRGF